MSVLFDVRSITVISDLYPVSQDDQFLWRGYKVSAALLCNGHHILDTDTELSRDIYAGLNRLDHSRS